MSVQKKKKPDSTTAVVNFIAEAGLLKRVQRSGWWVTGIKQPESVADHCFRCAVIGYALAKLETCDPYPVLLMTLFNDIHEARVNDLHKMGQRYVDFNEVEDKAYAHQMSVLPSALSHELVANREEYRKQQSLASHIARDADILECLIQALEYQQQGFVQTEKFFGKAPRHLYTKSAKALWKKAKSMDLNQWWNDLSIFER